MAAMAPVQSPPRRVKVPGVGVKATQLLRRLADVKRVSNLEALELLPKLLRRKVLREPKEVTAAIRALTQRGLYREAAHFALDACAWTHDGYRTADAAAEAKDAKRVRGNAFVCGAAFHACGFVSDWPLTLQILQRAQDAHVELDASAEDSLLLALCRGGAPHLALQRPSNAGLKALSAAAAHMGRNSAWEMAIAILAKSSHWDQTAWEVLVAAAADATQWPNALAVLDAMGRSRGEASATAATLAAVACVGVQRFDLAHELLQKNRSDLPHETALTRLVVSAPSVGDGRWQWAMMVLDSMDRRHLKVPLSTCNAVISVCAQSGHWQRALSVLESMCTPGPAQRPAPDQISFNGALSACERAARPEMAARLLQRMTLLSVQPEVTSYTGLSAAYGRSTGWRMALSLFSTVRGRNLQPDEALLVATGMACGNQGFEKEAELIFQAQPWQHASQLLSEVAKQRIQQSVASTSCLTSCLEKGFQWALAVHSLEAAKQKDLKSLKSYGAALAALQQADAPWRAAVETLEDMSSRRVEISSIALQAGVEVLESRPQLHQLLVRLRQQCEAEDPSVLTTASYSMLYHGMLDAQLQAILERKILRPCARRLCLTVASAGRTGPLADTVLSAQGFLGAAAAPLFAQRHLLAPPGKLLRGRLEARRLHHLLGAPSAERSSLAAKSIPAFVTSSLKPSTLGRLVGHRSAAAGSFLTSVLADHDRSQHAERQALLSLVEGLDLADPEGEDLTGAIQLYISAHPCISCTAVFFQLTQLWPGVRLRVAFDAWEDTRRWTVGDSSS